MFIDPQEKKQTEMKKKEEKEEEKIFPPNEKNDRSTMFKILGAGWRYMRGAALGYICNSDNNT